MHKYIFLALFLISSICSIGCSGNMPAEELFNKGKAKLSENKPKAAYIYFKKAVKKEPENPKYYWAVAKVAPDHNEAFIHTKGAWDNGLKTKEVLISLINLSIRTQEKVDPEHLLSLYKQLPDSIKNEELRGQIYFMSGAYDSSIAIWKKLFEINPTGDLGNKLASAYTKKRDNESAISILSYCREKKLLDTRGYKFLSALYIIEYEYQEVEELFSEAKKLGYYNDTLQLEQANFYTVQGKFKEAETLLLELKTPVGDESDNSISHGSRIMLSYIYGVQKKRDKIEELIQVIPDDFSKKSDEILCHRAIIKSMIDTAEAIEEFKKLGQKFPQNPFVAILYARENIRKGNLKVAIEIYKQLPGIYNHSPRILTQIAWIYSKIGEDEKALSALSVLHSRKHFTKRSVELFRDISLKLNLLKQSKAAQALLDKKFSNDASVRWGKAILALKTGEIDSAIVIFSQLYKDYPDAHQIEISRLSAYLIKKDYTAAIKECKNTKAPFTLHAPILARAFSKLGETEKAEKVYKKLLEKDKKPSTMLEYSDFLLQSGKTKEGSIVLNELLISNAKLLKKNPKGNAIVLNNYAWSLIQMEGFDKKTALSAAKKAHELAPDNKQIIDTYADVLMRCDKYKQCIKVLENSKLTQKEPKLLYFLGTCYEKIKVINKAALNYKEAMALYESENILPTTISKNKLNNHITRLLAKQVGRDLKGDASVLNDYAQSLMKTVGFDKKAALSAAKKAYKLDPDDKKILSTYADILIQCKKYKQCIKALQGNNLVEKEPRLLFYLATCYEKINDINKAVRTYKDAIELYDSENVLPMPVSINTLNAFRSRLLAKVSDQDQNPKESAALLNTRAQSIMQKKGFDKKAALSTAKQAYSLDPDNKKIVNTYADILIQCKKYKQCIKVLQGNNLVEKEPRLLFYLGTCYEKIKDINKAVRTYQDALKLYDAENILPVSISKSKLNKHITKLISSDE